MIAAFHTHDGWFWERGVSGCVRITKREGDREDGAILAEHVMHAPVWASVVASVSALGGENGRYYEALAFHEGPSK